MKSVRHTRSPLRLRNLLLAAVLLALPVAGSGQASASAEVKAVVERFLAAAGRQDLDSLPAMFAPGASIASASLRQGTWVTTSQSAQE